MKILINEGEEVGLEHKIELINDGNNDKNKFLLKSVIVHMGNTEQGHYYAFIRKEGDKWYQFNDNNITEFNPELKKLFLKILVFYD